MPDHDAHDIIVLFSKRSRDAYAAEAKARGETYTFTDAWGRWAQRLFPAPPDHAAEPEQAPPRPRPMEVRPAAE